MTASPLSSELALSDDKGVLQLVLDLEQTGAIDAVSLTLTNPDLEQEVWQSLGKLLGRIDRASRWWIGDWLNFGEEHYGEDHAQAVESTTRERYDALESVTGLDPGTLMNIRSICGRVPRSRRRANLGFWIHAEVAALEPAEQENWLQRAVDEAWTRAELRDAIRESRNPGKDDDGGGDDHGGGGGGEGGLTLAERLEAAARVVWTQGQSTSDGSVLVPREAWSQLGAALGEGK